LAALGVGWVTVLLRRYGKIMRIVEIVMGVILVIAGILLFLGSFSVLAGYVPFFDIGF
jgi:threonine/homoserine/homoserine lactone efflux protein